MERERLRLWGSCERYLVGRMRLECLPTAGTMYPF